MKKQSLSFKFDLNCRWAIYVPSTTDVNKHIDNRQEVIDWQHEAGERSMSYGELAEAGEYFEKLGRRYGLLREFRENAMPC